MNPIHSWLRSESKTKSDDNSRFILKDCCVGPINNHSELSITLSSTNTAKHTHACATKKIYRESG